MSEIFSSNQGERPKVSFKLKTVDKISSNEKDLTPEDYDDELDDIFLTYAPNVRSFSYLPLLSIVDCR